MVSVPREIVFGDARFVLCGVVEYHPGHYTAVVRSPERAGAWLRANDHHAPMHLDTLPATLCASVVMYVRADFAASLSPPLPPPPPPPPSQPQRPAPAAKKPCMKRCGDGREYCPFVEGMAANGDGPDPQKGRDRNESDKFVCCNATSRPLAADARSG